MKKTIYDVAEAAGFPFHCLTGDQQYWENQQDKKYLPS